MAVKKSKTKPAEAEAAVTKAPKKAPKKKAAAPKVAAKTTAPKTAKVAEPAKKQAAKKKAAPVKLTDNQTELLKKVHGTGDVGHPAVSKADTKALESLKDKKLIKKGKKNKESGHVHYHVSKAGEKHVGSSSNPPA